MPVPEKLTSAFYHRVWDGMLPVVGADHHGARQKNKHFYAYLEVGDQCKHDNSMRAYCRRHNVADRRTQDTQVKPANDGSFDYYREKGEVASKRVARFMHEKWSANSTNSSVFDSSGHQALTIQKEVQSDGWGYEITMYYRGSDVYVSFHCYPA